MRRSRNCAADTDFSGIGRVLNFLRSLPQSRWNWRSAAIDDESWIWLDGKFLGAVTKQTNPKDYWLAIRRYRFAPGALKPGRHELVILCNDVYHLGGISGHPRLSSARDLFPMHVDQAIPEDDPYRYYHW